MAADMTFLFKHALPVKANEGLIKLKHTHYWVNQHHYTLSILIGDHK